MSGGLHTTPVYGRVTAAVLQTLAERGPNPTLFRASPAAPFWCEGREFRCAPGWWVIFACEVEVTSVQEEDGDDALDVVTLTFRPPGPELHDGRPFWWEFSVVARDGVQRLILRDIAEYPAPLSNYLSYLAIGQCRDAMLRGTARRLGCEMAGGFASLALVARAVSSLLGGASRPAASSSSSKMWREDEGDGLAEEWGGGVMALMDAIAKERESGMEDAEYEENTAQKDYAELMADC